MFFSVKDEMAQGFQMFKWYPSDEKAQLRRSIYAFQRRSLIDADDGSLRRGQHERELLAAERDHGGAAGAHVAQWRIDGSGIATLRGARDRVAGPDPERQIGKAFALALLREPAGAEMQKARTLYDGRKS